ncbi:hypothetical protein [Ferroplasma acidiphilum]|uniref:hypothetical protein n=1 Tax=Ferroplasma acidiphilum TaxID=74969 RepID=UPI0028168985|nr:hypothetical protein [Ferroplasma acidiphilum]WMT53757.1 MAG: hypothetical protein RE473_02645 [Ferroplasma acidiphilum]
MYSWGIFSRLAVSLNSLAMYCGPLSVLNTRLLRLELLYLIAYASSIGLIQSLAVHVLEKMYEICLLEKQSFTAFHSLLVFIVSKSI